MNILYLELEVARAIGGGSGAPNYDLLSLFSSNPAIVEHGQQQAGTARPKPWASERAVRSYAPTYETSPSGECGVAFKALSHWPRL